MFCFLNMTVDNLYYIICFGYIFRNVVTNNLTLIVSINNFFLHHSFTNSRHLRTVFRIDDSSYNVTTKSWTNLIQQIFISNPILLVFMITDFQLSTVGSQTTCQSWRNTRSQVTTDNGSSHQTDLWFFFLKQVDKNRSMRKWSIREQARSIEYMNTVYSVWQNLFFYIGKVAAGTDCFQLASQLIG